MSDIVIAPSGSLGRGQIATLASTGDFAVLYLGSSYSHYSWLRDHLPPGWSMLVPGPLLNSAAARMRDLVINLDSLAWPQGSDRAAWDASRLGERGPLASSLMLNLCRLAVFAETVAKPGQHLVIGDDTAQCRLWMRQARQRGHSVAWLGRTADPLRTVRRVLGSVRRRTSMVFRFAARKLRLAYHRRRHPLPVTGLRDCNLLMTVWGRSDTFSKKGPIAREDNFGRLPALLRQAGFRVAYLVYPLYTAPFREVIANALEANDPVILVEDLVPWWAILAAAFAGLDFPSRVEKLPMPHVDATPVIRLEAERDRELASCSEAQLLRHAGERLAEFGLHPDLLLHLYEAQPWEKMLARGVRKRLPSTRIVGVQHAPFSESYISFFPSRRSITEGAVPDLFLTSGRGYAQWLREAGIPSERLGVIGAIRYEDAPALTAPRGHAILCCTGIDLDEAIELATKAALSTAGLDRPLIINYHPVTDDVFRAAVRREVMRATSGRSGHIGFSTSPMRALLSDADVVLYTTSAACFEAVLAGRLAIYVARDLQLDYDKLPDSIALRCRSVEEIRALLGEADPASMTSQSRVALEAWLGTVVDAPGLRALLEPQSDMTCKEGSAMRGAM